MRLFVGDPHIQPSNLKDSQKLIDFIVETIKSREVDEVIFSGDLFHTHVVVNVRVQDFWKKAFSKIFNDTYVKNIVALVGNHDMPGDKESQQQITSLDMFEYLDGKLSVVKRSHFVGDVGYMAYFSDNEDFVKESQKLLSNGVKFLFCHQTFQGSKFDNGMYAPEGIEVEKVSGFKKIIAGHIHSFQEFANIVYPGTPKWDTASDANKDKGIWLVDDNFNLEFISTESVVTPIKKFSVLEGEEIPVLPENSINVVELIGSSIWIGSVSKKLRGKCRLSAKPTDSATRRTTRAAVIIDDYAKTFKIPESITSEELLEYVRNL